MAKSSCVKCGGQSFECREVQPEGLKYVLMFVQCADCGGVVGVMEDQSISLMLAEIKNLVLLTAE
jgi:hypothetical protein